MLLVNEIYAAICGESRFSGQPCTLVRLTGCHIRCRWCDTAHSFAGGQTMSAVEVVRAVGEHGHRLVLLTGGEPLLQPDVVPLMAALLADGRQVVLETSGTLGPRNMVSLAKVPAGVHRVVDLKAPGSSISSEEIDWPGVALLDATDELKIVCVGRDDYLWGRTLVQKGNLWPAAVRVAFSAVAGELAPATLAQWLLADRLEAVLQIQLHKVLWPDRERGV